MIQLYGEIVHAYSRSHWGEICKMYSTAETLILSEEESYKTASIMLFHVRYKEKDTEPKSGRVLEASCQYLSSRSRIMGDL